jgi:hypothetical protein
MKTTTTMLLELQTRFGYAKDRIKTDGDWIIVYSEAEKKHVRLIIKTATEGSSEQAVSRANAALLRKAHQVGADYALGVIGNMHGGFRFAYHTRGRHDGALAGGLPAADGKLLPWKSSAGE